MSADKIDAVRLDNKGEGQQVKRKPHFYQPPISIHNTGLTNGAVIGSSDIGNMLNGSKNV